MKKFIFGVFLGVLIAGGIFLVLKQGENVSDFPKNSDTLSKIRNKQVIPKTNLQEDLQKFAANLMQAKSPQEMISSLDKIIQIRPQDSNLYALKSQLLQQQGNLKQALKEIDKAISLDPQNANYYRIRAELEFALQDFTKAERDFTVAAQISGKADNFYNRAITNLNLGNYAAANMDFKTAQKLYKKEGNDAAAKQAKEFSKILIQNMPQQNTNLQMPDKGKKEKTKNESQNAKAVNETLTSKISQSLKHFSQSETLKDFQNLLPQSSDKMPSLEELLNHQEMKPPKISKKDLLQGTALESVAKAKQLIQEKDFEGAKKVLDKAIEIFPQDDSLYYNRAQANYAQGNYKEAFKDVDKALMMNPKNYQAALSKGDMLQSFGQSEQAKKAYQDAMNIAEENGNKKAAEDAKARYELLEGKGITAKTNQRLTEAANAYYKGDYDTAANIFNQLYKENPSAENAYNLGLAYNSQGKTKEAGEMFAFAADNKPQDLNSQILAAQSAVQLNDFDKAQQYLEQAKKLDDTNPDIWSLSAQIASNNQDYTSVKNDLHMALDGYHQRLSQSQDEAEKKRIEDQIRNIEGYLEQIDNL